MIVPDATTGPTLGPVDGRLADGQVAVHWAAPAGRLEVRWPPDQRSLYTADGPPFSGAFIASRESADGRTIRIGDAVADGQPTMLTLVLRTGVVGLLARPCDRVAEC